jgi:MoxR-like ATPase
MAKKTSFKAWAPGNENSHYLFLGGQQIRDILTPAHATATECQFPPSNFAKIALVKNSYGTVAIKIKPTPVASFRTISFDSNPVVQEHVINCFANAMRGMAHMGGMLDIIRPLVRANGHPSGDDMKLICANFTTLYAAIKTEQDSAPQKESGDAPPPTEARQYEDGEPRPAKRERGAIPADLKNFGEFGTAIHNAIETAIDAATTKTEAIRVVHITVPGYTPVQLPDGEVVHEQFKDLLFRMTTLSPKQRQVLLLGERGTGKTHAAEQLARVMGLRFTALSMSGGTTERAFHGAVRLVNGSMVWQPSAFLDYFQNGGVFLVDELDKADSTVATSLNMALANGYCVPVDSGVRIDRHENCIVIAAANALGSSRTYTASNRLDASTVERFAIMHWGMSNDILRRMAAECGDSAKADSLLRLTHAIRERIVAKGWSGEIEWGARTVQRMASWLRGGKTRAEALTMELEQFTGNEPVRSEFLTASKAVI